METIHRRIWGSTVVPFNCFGTGEVGGQGMATHGLLTSRLTESRVISVQTVKELISVVENINAYSKSETQGVRS